MNTDAFKHVAHGIRCTSAVQAAVFAGVHKTGKLLYVKIKRQRCSDLEKTKLANTQV